MACGQQQQWGLVSSTNPPVLQSLETAAGLSQKSQSGLNVDMSESEWCNGWMKEMCLVLWHISLAPLISAAGVMDSSMELRSG